MEGGGENNEGERELRELVALHPLTKRRRVTDGQKI